MEQSDIKNTFHGLKSENQCKFLQNSGHWIQGTYPDVPCIQGPLFCKNLTNCKKLKNRTHFLVPRVEIQISPVIRDIVTKTLDS